MNNRNICTPLVLFLFFLVSNSATGAYLKSFKSKVYASIDVGVFKTNLVGSGAQRLDGYLRPRLEFEVNRRLTIGPSLGVAFPFRSGADGSVKTVTTQFDVDAGIVLNDYLTVVLGPGMQMLVQFGSGEDVVLNNGTSTSTFATGSGVRTSMILSVDFGLRIRLPWRVSLTPMLYVLDVASSSRRAWNASLTLDVLLGS